jgi:hypothetical protein
MTVSLVAGLLQYNGAWHDGNLVFLDMMPTYIPAYELLLKYSAPGLVRFDGKTSLDSYGGYFLAWSGVCCVDGKLVVHNIPPLSAMGIQWLLLLNAYLVQYTVLLSVFQHLFWQHIQLQILLCLCLCARLLPTDWME